MYKVNKQFYNINENKLDEVYKFAEEYGVYIPITISSFLVTEIDCAVTDNGKSYIKLKLFSGREFTFTGHEQVSYNLIKKENII